MGAKHNLPSLKTAIMDSPDQEHFDRVVVVVGGVGVGVGGGGKLFLTVLKGQPLILGNI